jgi:hypothetical protein
MPDARSSSVLKASPFTDDQANIQARLCAKLQPQPVTAGVLRLVFDTAALREISKTNRNQIAAGQLQASYAGCEIMKPNRSRSRWECCDGLATVGISQHWLGLIQC